MTPEQELAVMSNLSAAAVVIEGCALREADVGVKERLYEFAAHLRAVLKDITPSPSTAAYDEGFGPILS